MLPGGPALVRNYDWDYRLSTPRWPARPTAGVGVLGMLDCLRGLLDGVSEAGLALS